MKKIRASILERRGDCDRTPASVYGIFDVTPFLLCLVWFFRLGPDKEKHSYQDPGEDSMTRTRFFGLGEIAVNFFPKRPSFEYIIGALFFLFMEVVYSLMLAGIFRLWFNGKYFELFVLLVLIIYFITLTGIVGHARNKLPVIPFYSLLGGMGIIGILKKDIKR